MIRQNAKYNDVKAKDCIKSNFNNVIYIYHTISYLTKKKNLETDNK